nr:hypothetical protein [uncultured Sphaerochaeta sp.]
MVGFPVKKLPELSASINAMTTIVKEQGSIRFLLFFIYINKEGNQ